MVYGIIYFVLLAIIIATNTYHYKVERNLNAEIDWWREACVKNENELNALKEKQPKRKTIENELNALKEKQPKRKTIKK